MVVWSLPLQGGPEGSTFISRTAWHFRAFLTQHPHLRQVYDAFGPQRIFWGTDITRMPCSWRQCITLFTEELPWLTGHDLELVMGRAFCDWIGWKVPEA
jgi:hypothetical protein